MSNSAPRTIAWVDGANSAVMAYLVLQQQPDLVLAHCDLGTSVHPDSHRFINDLEGWYGKPIVRVRSSEFANIDELFEARRYHAGTKGAPCTGKMKIVPRMNYQLPSDLHLWGYTADKTDVKRFEGMKERFPLLRQRSPLIEWKLRKADTHAILKLFGVRRPLVYDLGLPNGNCLGCVKASSPGYWAMIRKHFPEVFARRAEQSRRFGSRLTRINKKRIFIDEIPADWPLKIGARGLGGCGFHCKGGEA